MDNNQLNKSQQKQQNKTKKKGIALWWHNLGKGGRIAICCLTGVAVVTAVVVPTVIAINKNKTVEPSVTVTGADFDKENSHIELNKDSYIVLKKQGRNEILGVKEIKVGSNVIKATSDYTYDDDTKKIEIKAHAMTSVNIEIQLNTKELAPGEVLEKNWDKAIDLICVHSENRNYEAEFTNKSEYISNATFTVNFDDLAYTNGNEKCYEKRLADNSIICFSNFGGNYGNHFEVDSCYEANTVNDNDLIHHYVSDVVNLKGKYSQYTFDKNTKKYLYTENTKEYIVSFNDDLHLESYVIQQNNQGSITEESHYNFKNYGLVETIKLPEISSNNTLYCSYDQTNNCFKSGTYSFLTNIRQWATHNSACYYTINLKDAPNFLTGNKTKIQLVGSKYQITTVGGLPSFLIDGKSKIDSLSFDETNYFFTIDNSFLTQGKSIITLIVIGLFGEGGHLEVTQVD